MSLIENDSSEHPGVEALLGHSFTKPELLREALTHSSYSNEKANQDTEVLKDNERLEFLGDAVIGLVVGQLLMQRFPGANEGWLSKWRSSLVSSSSSG